MLETAAAPLSLTAISHVGVRVVSLDASLAFYRTLGFELAWHDEVHRVAGLELNLWGRRFRVFRVVTSRNTRNLRPRNSSPHPLLSSVGALLRILLGLRRLPDCSASEERLIYHMFADTGVQAKAIASAFEVQADLGLPVFDVAHGVGGGGHGKKSRRWRMAPLLRITANPTRWGFIDDRGRTPCLSAQAVTSAPRGPTFRRSQRRGWLRSAARKTS